MALAGAEERLEPGRERNAIAGGERVAVAVGDRDRGVDVVEPREDGLDEAGVEERRVDRGGERHLRTPGEGAEADREAAEGALPLHRIGDRLDAGGQRRELLSGRRDRHHRPSVGRAEKDAGDPRDEGLAVPVEERLRPAHPARPAADQEDGARLHRDDRTRRPGGAAGARPTAGRGPVVARGDVRLGVGGVGGLAELVGLDRVAGHGGRGAPGDPCGGPRGPPSAAGPR